MGIEINDLKISELNKIYNFKVYPGITWLKGENGSGKTLVLDAISGVRKTHEGRISFSGSLIYLNQIMYFSDRLRVRDFIKFIYLLDGKSQWEGMFSKFLQGYDIDLKDVWDKKMGQLSGGEKQFIYTLGILSFNRQWYLLDEPLIYVDTAKKKVLLDIIKAKKEQGANVILTSHEDIPEELTKDWHTVYI